MAYKSLFAESEDKLIPIPEGFEKDYISGNHWRFYKILPNNMVASIAGEKLGENLVEGQTNTAILFVQMEDYELGEGGNVRESREFKTEEELNKILSDWEKEDPMKESTHKPLFVEESKHNIDEIVKHYLMAALWSTLHNDDEYLDHYYSLSDISEETKEKAKKDVEQFLAKAEPYLGDEATDEQIGHDLLLTRNHEGAGFWDRDFYLDGDKLTEIAHAMGEINFHAEHNVVESDSASGKGPMDESAPKPYKSIFG